MNLTCTTNSAVNGEYYYIRNAQGDITGLFNKSGDTVATYIYDSWGQTISVDGSLKDTVGKLNPYRYRGYRYDSETGLYYLQSRYYNPAWGRFINADAIAGVVGEILGHNVFAYCKNNVVNAFDPSGFRLEFIDETANLKYQQSLYEKSVKPAVENNSNKSLKQYVVDSLPGLSAGTLFSIGESIAAEATLGYAVIPYGKMPIPIKLSTFEMTGNFFMAAGLFSLNTSINDNFSGQYSNSQAWIRTGVDVVAFGAGIAFTAGGGWAAVGVGLLIGVTSEGVKAGVDYLYTRKVTN